MNDLSRTKWIPSYKKLQFTTTYLISTRRGIYSLTLIECCYRCSNTRTAPPRISKHTSSYMNIEEAFTKKMSCHFWKGQSLWEIKPWTTTSDIMKDCSILGSISKLNTSFPNIIPLVDFFLLTYNNIHDIDNANSSELKHHYGTEGI